LDRLFISGLDLVSIISSILHFYSVNIEAVIRSQTRAFFCLKVMIFATILPLPYQLIKYT
jgi:hypothetical protein